MYVARSENLCTACFSTCSALIVKRHAKAMCSKRVCSIHSPLHIQSYSFLFSHKLLACAANGAEAYPEEPTYVKVPENKPVLEVLRHLGNYATFLQALKVRCPFFLFH